MTMENYDKPYDILRVNQEGYYWQQKPRLESPLGISCGVSRMFGPFETQEEAERDAVEERT